MEKRSTRSSSKKTIPVTTTTTAATDVPIVPVKLRYDYSLMSDTSVVTMKILREYVHLALNSASNLPTK